MIKRIKIDNFKSLEHVNVELGAFTVLIGKNGAGKTAFLQALDVLSWLVRNASINETFEREGVSFNELVYLKAHRRRMYWDCEIEVVPDGSAQPVLVNYFVGISKRRHVHVLAEKGMLADEKETDLRKMANKGRPFLGRLSRRIALASEGSDELRYEGAVLAHSLLREIREQRVLFQERFPVLGALAEELGGYRHFQIWGPEFLRRPSTGRAGVLSKNGGNLPSVIAWLKRNRPDSYVDLLKEMRSVYAWLDDIELRHLGEDRFSLRFMERPGQHAKRRLAYQPSQVSDGFLRMLALTTLKHQRGLVRILGYEEPENGLHPQVLQESVRRLKDIAIGGTQVIVTTHSPYLLDYLMDEDTSLRPQLKVVHRAGDGATEILPVSEEKLAKARSRGISAGELWTLLVDELELVGGGDVE